MATLGVEDVLTELRVLSTSWIAGLEAELVATHEATFNVSAPHFTRKRVIDVLVPFDDLDINASERVAEEETSHGVSSLVSFVQHNGDTSKEDRVLRT